MVGIRDGGDEVEKEKERGGGLGGDLAEMVHVL